MYPRITQSHYLNSVNSKLSTSGTTGSAGLAIWQFAFLHTKKVYLPESLVTLICVCDQVLVHEGWHLLKNLVPVLQRAHDLNIVT